MIHRRWPVCLSLATAVLLAGSSANAGDSVTAEALFRAGRDAVEKGDYKTACAKFEESHKLEPAAGTALNLGDCSEHLGHLATAWQRYQEAADRFGSDDRADFARKKVTELTPKLARLTLQIAPGTPEGAVLSRDGIEVGTAVLDLPVPIDAGDHRITVTLPGHAPKEITVHVEDGEQKILECAPGPVIPGRSGGDSPSSSVAFPIGITVGAIGLLGVGAGVATGLLTIDRRDVVRANCDALKACNPAGIAAASEGKTFSAVSTAAFIGGGVALAAGVTLVILGRPNKAPPATAALRATAAPTFGGLTLTATF